MFIWTDALISRAGRMHAGGMTAAQIACEIVDENGTRPSRRAVIGALYRARGGVALSPEDRRRGQLVWHQDRVDALRALVDSGRTVSESAEALSRQFGERFSSASVYDKARKIGLQFQGRGRRTIQNRSTALPCAKIDLAPPQPESAAPMIGADGCGILDLVDRSCRWINGDPAGKHSWCGKTRERGFYCADHAKIAYLPPANRTEKNKATAIIMRRSA